MVKVIVFVEGGGNRKLDDACRRGFRQFFIRAGLNPSCFSIVACGNATKACERFVMRLNCPLPNEVSLLLVDSEEPVAAADAWSHLSSRKENKLRRPVGASDDSAQLMVQCMEAWFLADRETLKAYFGQSFSDSKLPSSANIEAVAKDRTLESLKDTTRESKKGRYDKGEHSFAILERLDASKVVKASHHAEALIAVIRSKSTAETK